LTRANLGPMARMAAHLEPGQVVHRTRLQLQRSFLHRWPEAGRRLCVGPDPAAAIGWPPDFQPLDSHVAGQWPTAAMLRAGRICLLGKPGNLGDWQQREMPLLWRFHLHYWDWGWGLAADPDRGEVRTLFARLWRSWREANPFGRGDAWYPYPVALRSWSWCGLYRDLVANGEIEAAYIGDLAAHAGFLRRHLESDVRGNHLIKDLKAQVGLAVFFNDDRQLHRALRQVAKQLRDQVLPDGGHYERSPAYHCQVLADLVDIDGLLRSVGREDVAEITEAIRRMRRWLGGMLGPDGTLPMLNDGYPVADRLIAALRPKSPPEASRLLAMPSSGYVHASVGEWRLLADVGAPCPDGLPGHAHADTLGCVVHVGRTPLLVDTGTSTYQPGAVRDYERSTSAHNTLEVDGSSSTEVWGAFRAGRRARIHGFAARSIADGVTIQATHDGFRGLSGRPHHRRRWELTSAGLLVEDVVTGTGWHAIAVYWHLAPQTAVEIKAGSAKVKTADAVFVVDIDGSWPPTLALGVRKLATGFMQTTDAPVLSCLLECVLPVRLTTKWRQIRESYWSTKAEGAA
jgi:uncharacterized heparinase superfamily protein